MEVEIDSNTAGASDVGTAVEADPVLTALQDLVRAGTRMTEAAAVMAARAQDIRVRRDEDVCHREIVMTEERPLIAEMLADTIQHFETAGRRSRQAEARALHQEGLTMEQIAELFGLTRQRISVLLRSAGGRAQASRTSQS